MNELIEQLIRNYEKIIELQKSIIEGLKETIRLKDVYINMLKEESKMTKEEKVEDEVEIEQVDAFQCPDCGAIYEDVVDAQECCPKEVESIVAYECPKCKTLYEDEDEAKECCGK